MIALLFRQSFSIFGGVWKMKDTDDDLPIKASRTASHCNYSL